jgi:hypothetical protein
MTNEPNMKNKVSAVVVCDSINDRGSRLTTLQIHCPTFILQEFNTHRVFSRSFNSSRAIPAAKYRLSADFEPDAWLSNQSGMTGGEELTGWRLLLAKTTWAALSSIVKLGQKTLDFAGLHKQYTNRWLLPIAWADGVVSSTEWDNYIALRTHSSAQPEMQQLAKAIKLALLISTPDLLEEGEWHLPYIDVGDLVEASENEPDPEKTYRQLALISASRCARVSYGFKDKKDTAADIKRINTLLGSSPIHAAPTEHVAQCPGSNYPVNFNSGNFHNWVQLREILEKEASS